MPARRSCLPAALLFLASLGVAHAQPAPMDHASGAPGQAPSTEAFRQSMAQMHEAMMDQPFTGNPDRDFVAGMLPHHQGAIDMARVELRYGHDPRLRRLAQDIIVAQTREIAQMRDWQRQHGQPPAAR